MGRRDQFKTNNNPAELTIEWAGDRDDGFFYFYDKEAKQKVKLSDLRFAVLGERHGITGYSQDMKTGLYSNEVGSTENQTITVKYYKDGKSHELVSGKYKDIKEVARAKGGKFTSFVYALVLDCNEIDTGTIVKILMSGACTSPWIDFKKSGGAENGVELNGYTDASNGGIKFRAPVFAKTELDETEDSEAEDAYGIVATYFKNAPHTTHQEDTDSPSDYYTDADIPAEDEDEDDFPF